MKRILMMVLALAMSAAVAEAKIVGKDITYSADGTELKGYIAYDDAVEGTRPGILIVHEWWGHNDYVRQRARMLAEEGYTAFALDMYGEGKTADHPSTAGEFAGQVRADMKGTGQERFLAAMDVLQDHETVDPENISAIGYCFGGGTVLHMARYGVDLDLVASFHGSLGTETPAGPGDITADVLVFHGADDTFVSDEEIAKFKEEMETAGADYKFISYKGAVHSFTNPEADTFAKKFGMGVGYNKAADQQSWNTLLESLDAIY